MLSTVFAVMICCVNCFLANMVIYSVIWRYIMNLAVFGFLEFAIIKTTFKLDEMETYTLVTIMIAVFYTMIMVPIFGYISGQIQ